MKKFIFILIIIILIIAGVWYFQKGTENSDQTSTLISQAIFDCDNNKTIDASFYEGAKSTDIDLNEPPTPTGSVKLILDDGRNLDLQQTISADGGRYANDDEAFVFWNKGNEALVLENGTTSATYINCISSNSVVDNLTIKVTSPNGGEIWTKGQDVKITWEAPSEIELVNIRLSISNDGEGQTFNAAIASGVPNIGEYNWTVKELYAEVLGITDLPLSDKYIVTVEDSANSTIFDNSDAPFSIE